jgi:hypothetical protein
MPFAISAVLLVFWMVIAYREYQRGDLLLAGVFALVGIVLTVYRIRLWQAKQAAKADEKSPV